MLISMFFFFSFLDSCWLKVYIGHITAASTAQSPTTWYHPQLVSWRHFPLAQQERQAGKQGEACYCRSHTVMGRWGGNDCDCADVTSMTTLARWAQCEDDDHHHHHKHKNNNPPWQQPLLPWPPWPWPTTVTMTAAAMWTGLRQWGGNYSSPSKCIYLFKIIFFCFALKNWLWLSHYVTDF